jgi:hypothetical protein
MLTRIRLVAALVVAACIGVSAAAPAQAQSIRIEILKAGFVVGVSGGSGTLTFQGKRYPLSIGGVSLGATIGASKAVLVGSVSNLRSPSDIAGTYGATEAGIAVVRGKKSVRLKNAKGVILNLRGSEVGLEFSLDLSGMQIALK